MKINENTITVLKNFLKINPSVVLDQGNVIKTISTNKTIMAKATLEDSFPQKIPLYELSKFISSWTSLKDPDVTIEGSTIHFKDSEQEYKFLLSDETTIVKPPEKDITLPSVDVTVTLTDAHLSAVEKAAGVLDLGEVHVTGDGTSIFLKAADAKKIGSESSIKIGETDKKFNAIFKFENLKMLPGNYDVSICSRGIAKFVGKNIEYLIAVESSSTF